jgi:hypothetical protein
VNARQLRDFLDAAAACDPAGSYAGPLELAAAVAAEPAAEWELALRGGEQPALRVLPRAAALPPGPWNGAAWSAASGRWKAFAAPGESRVRRFSADAFVEPIGSALAAFDALAPIAEIRDGDRGSAWTLALAEPLGWPRFLGCDLAAAFAPRAAALSLLLRDARLVALDFDGEELWARLIG